MKHWKLFTGIVTAVLAIVTGILCRANTLILVSQILTLLGAAASIIGSRMLSDKLSPVNGCIIVLYGLSFCIGLYGHAGFWLYTVSAVCAVICCLGACLSIAARQ